MSTLSTKYVPHKLRPENIIDSSTRQATFPSNQEHLKTALYASSVCIGEPERTKSSYDTTKGDDFDKVGTMLLETAMDRKLQIDKERENTDKYLHDLRGVHFEVGYDDRKTYLKSHKQESYQRPSEELFAQNKKDIVSSGEGYNRGMSSIIRHIPEDWKQCLTTIARNDYISPEAQMSKNKELGKEEIPRSRPTMEKSTVIAGSSLKQESTTTITDIKNEVAKEAQRIIEDMRKCHYTSNHDQPISQETEFRRHFGMKENKDLRYTVEFSRNSSQVVMGYDTEDDMKDKYATTYKNYIHESANSIQHSIEKAKQERNRRDATTEFMRKSSVELGTEKNPLLSTTQIDFRPVKF